MKELRSFLEASLNNNFTIAQIPFISKPLQPDIIEPLPLSMNSRSLYQRVWNYYKENSLYKLIYTVFLVFLHKIRSVYYRIILGSISEYINFDLNLNKIKKAYYNLNDNHSKNLYLRLISYRILTPQKVKLPLSNPESWQEVLTIKNKCQLENYYYTQNWKLYLQDLNSIGYPIKYYTLAEGIFINFVLKQYEYNNNKTIIKPCTGDYIIDGGACFGDTALLFANQIGDSGKVFSFEFVEDNLKLFHKNIQLNPELEKRIELSEFALWHKSNELLYFEENGAATMVKDNNSKVEQEFNSVQTKSIDDFILQNKISKIDFIKLDIEGAELNCLKGAKNTIKKFKPKLAICIYHQFEHFFLIPLFVKKLVSSYKIFIDHYSAHYGETVMYAISEEEKLV